MLNKIINFLKIGKSDTETRNFFDFKLSEQKKIIKGAVNEANEEQTQLIRRYEEKHGRIDMNKFVRYKS